MGGTEYLIAAGLGALQTVQSVASTRREASFSQQQAEYARAQAAAEAFEARRKTKRELGRNRARVAAAGVTIEGSPVEVLADLAGEGELDARRAEVQGEVAAHSKEFQARQSRSRAGQELLRGVDGFVGQIANAKTAFDPPGRQR